MIRSMTGYGRATVEEEALQGVVEVTSVNRKNLDIAVSLPREWQRLEPAIAEAVKRHVQRGRINIAISTGAPGNGEHTLFNPLEVERALSELAGLSEKMKVPFEPDLNLLFQVATSIRGQSPVPEPETIASGLMKALEKALAEMVEMRGREGEALQRDLEERKRQLHELLTKIREASAGVVPGYREMLLKRLRQSNLEFDLDDERVLKEIAIFADRCDISEEITRLESHLEQFDEFLNESVPVGRKFEFLLQEIGREFNTIGSKANDSAVSRFVIECKNELERIREQVLNVE